MSAPLLAMRAVHKRFPGVVALDDVSFTLEAGEIHGLVGENGAGKSTLMKVLGGAYQADEGTVELDGEPIEVSSPAEAADVGIAIVHQHLGLVPVLTVAENMLLGVERALVRRHGRHEVRKRVAKALDRVGIGNLVDERVERLRPAQQRLVMVAQGLLRDARVLVLDEPTAVLTPAEIDLLLAHVRTLRDEGIAIVYISHRLDEILAICDRLTVMRDGCVVFAGTPEGMDRDALSTLIVGRELERVLEDDRSHRVSPSAVPVLSCRGLTRSPAVQNVDLDLYAGEILGIAGLVGAGRTELVRLIVGADRADGGTVALHGEVIAKPTPRTMRERRVVLVPEDRRHLGIFPGMTVGQNLSLASLRRLGGSRGPILSRAEERRAAAAMAEALDVRPAGALDTPIELLSGGNQQKVIIGRWLMHTADVFVFDEPTEGIDVGGRAEIHRLVRSLADGGACVLVISSDLEELAALANRAIVLREGRAVAELSGDHLEESALLRHCFGTGTEAAA